MRKFHKRRTLIRGKNFFAYNFLWVMKYKKYFQNHTNQLKLDSYVMAISFADTL